MKPIIGIVSKYFKGDEELDRADSKIRNEIKNVSDIVRDNLK